MASKDYFDRIIASIQTDLTAQNKAILDLKTTVARQQKEIEALKASQNITHKSSELKQEKISTEHLLLAVKRVCDDVIRANYEQLPTIFADKKQFENFRKSTEQKFLSVETFTDYKKSLETRLKSIEEKQVHRYSLLTINRHNPKGDSDSKSYFKLDSILRLKKSINTQSLIPILVSLSIGMLAVYLVCSMTT